MARLLAGTLRTGFGHDQAAVFDESESIGSPRGWIPSRNVAIDRAVGSALPGGRIIEVYGANSSGKSTVADQIGAQCQAMGGLYAVADVERNRDRRYMQAIGVSMQTALWLGGNTVELLFEEIELLARFSASGNLVAWKQALDLAGYKTPALPSYDHQTYDPYLRKAERKKKPVASFTLYDWSMDHSAALAEYQAASGLVRTGTTDIATREALRPVVVYDASGAVYTGDTRSTEFRSAREALLAGEQPDGGWTGHVADRPIVACWDSIGGTTTQAEIEDGAGDPHPGRAAQAIKRNMRRLVTLFDQALLTLVVVNQEYTKIDMGGGPPRPGVGPKKDTYGGDGIKYHSCIRMLIERTGKIMASSAEDAAQIGQTCDVLVVKNKVAAPFRREEFGLIYGRGAENAFTIYHDLKRRGIIVQKGGWSQFTDPTVAPALGSFRGWQDLANGMAADPGLYVKLAGIYFEATK